MEQQMIIDSFTPKNDILFPLGPEGNSIPLRILPCENCSKSDFVMENKSVKLYVKDNNLTEPHIKCQLCQNYTSCKYKL